MSITIIGGKNNTSQPTRSTSVPRCVMRTILTLKRGTVYIFPSEISVDLLKEKRDSQAAGDLLDYMVTSGHRRKFK